MPKSSKKGSPRKARPLPVQGTNSDFTLAEFADSASPMSGRLKKGASTIVPPEAQSVQASEAVESLAWDEKDLSEFDDVDGPIHSFGDEDKPESVNPRSPVKKALKICNKPGYSYHIDIWFMISRYISPEDVGCFAAISQASHAVTHTAQFWMALYRRWFEEEFALPDRLMPHYLEKVHGMRARVVQALYYIYPPFASRVKRHMMFEDPPESLEGLSCVLMWHKMNKGHCHFFFKFQDNRSPCCLIYKPCGPLARFASDIAHNPEERCIVLEVICQYFLSLPVVMGNFLQKAYLSVGHGMRYHKLKLVFVPQLRINDKAALASGITVVMDPVVNLRVFRWWEPLYPLNKGT